jgi:tRNA dimethylallyltransferase
VSPDDNSDNAGQDPPPVYPQVPVLPPVVAVVGPTGTGKSDLAVGLALALNGEIINADALQFYRGMDIGTAKMPVQERRGVPHHLLDILDIREEANVATFQQQARAAVRTVQDRGRTPILVGGSGLYVRAALDVLEFPGSDPALRRQLEEDLLRNGFAALQARLAEVDPISAGRITDGRRLVRALEVHQLTGRPFSSFMPQRQYVQPTVQIGLTLERALLNQRLEQRVQHMVDAGFLAEVEELDRRGLRQGKTSSRALGYAQFLRVLDGDSTPGDAAADTVIATRQFAKRQMTWFRADPRVHWLDPFRQDPVPAAVEILQATIGPTSGQIVLP